MNPKDYRGFSKDIAEEVGVSQELVDALIPFYYHNVRVNLTNLTYPRIYVDNLGTFCLRKGKVEKALKRQQDIHGNLEKMTYKGYEKHMGVKEKITKMKGALKMLNKMQNDKREFKGKK